MNAILKLDCLNFIVIDIIPKFTNARNFSCAFLSIIVVSIAIGLVPLRSSLIILHLGKDASTFSCQLFIFLFHEVIIFVSRSAESLQFEQGGLPLRILTIL